MAIEGDSDEEEVCLLWAVGPEDVYYLYYLIILLFYFLYLLLLSHEWRCNLVYRDGLSILTYPSNLLNKNLYIHIPLLVELAAYTAAKVQCIIVQVQKTTTPSTTF